MQPKIEANSSVEQLRFVNSRGRLAQNVFQRLYLAHDYRRVAGDGSASCPAAGGVHEKSRERALRAQKPSAPVFMLIDMTRQPKSSRVTKDRGEDFYTQ